MVLLGSMYSQGLRGGPKSDTDVPSLCSSRLANLGYPRGMYNLGVMYETGRGVPPDPGCNLAKAAGWYEKAGTPDASYRLGLMYEQGRGVPKDPAAAKKYYLASGTPEAKTRLAGMAPQ